MLLVYKGPIRMFRACKNPIRKMFAFYTGQIYMAAEGNNRWHFSKTSKFFFSK